MDKSETLADDDTVTFGRFELSRGARVLRRDGEPIAVGSRAMALLVALTERAGAIVSNRELLQGVWPDRAVAMGTIRTQMTQLRRIFRDADPFVEYVQNINGRGYRFIAPVVPASRSAVARAACDKSVAASARQEVPRRDLPSSPVPVIGRGPSVRALIDRVKSQRLVTIVGQGGVGKTTLAVSVANALADSVPERWAHGVCFVNLASVKEASRVPIALTAALGVTSTTEDPLSEIVAFLSDRSLLLLLDNCEHVLDAAANFAERVLSGAPRVHVLSTSREPLRSVCESIYDLKGLDVPREQSAGTRSQLLQYPAVRFFVERAGALAVAELSDEDLPRVSDICRRLAGNPLALEIAAAHVELVGLGRTPIANPGDYLQLLSAGVCTGGPRHRTLQATFDWSYHLLSPVERSVFRRLSVFADRFDLDEAAAVLVDGKLSYTTLFECLINLVQKSLLVADTAEDKVLYRLPDVLRAYAGSKVA